VFCFILTHSVVCIIRGMLCSCRSAGESECVVLGRSVYVCVSYEECRIAVGQLERVRGVGQVRLCVCVI